MTQLTGRMRYGIWIGGLSVFMVSVSVRANVFAPAFGPDAIDFDRSYHLVGSERHAVDRERVLRTLGLEAALPPLHRHTNREDRLWQLGEADGEGETEFTALLALTAPVAVGTLAISAEYLDGRLGDTGKPTGQIWFWRPDAGDEPDLGRAEGWEPVSFEPAQPFVRFAALPPGTRTRAFLYRESRASGEARIRHWRFYRRRLFNVTPAARASGQFGVRGADPRNLPRGGTWRSGYMPTLPSREHPIHMTLTWPEPATLSGLFFCSDALDFEIVRFTGRADANPALAGGEDWEVIEPRATQANHHGRPHHVYRWIELAGPVEVRALRLNVSRAAGQFGDEYNTWVAGFGAFVDLGDGPPPELTPPTDPEPPVRVTFDTPIRGEASLVVNDARGRRVRYLDVQRTVVPGELTQSWDLTDYRGRLVEPGRYEIEMLVLPPLRLRYGMTPYPNVNQRHPERTPWLRHHTGRDGWLSDHAANQSVAVVGDRIFFSAWFCEAGVALIECDPDGNKLWGQRWGSHKLASDGSSVFFAQHNNRIVRMDPATRETTDLAPLLMPDRSGSFRAFAGGPDRLLVAYGGVPLIENAARPGDVEIEAVFPRRGLWPGGQDAPRSYFLRALRLTGTPPGQHAPYPPTRPPAELAVYLDSTFGPQDDQYIMIPFRRSIALGSLMVPYPEADTPAVEFAVLKPDAAWPPNPGRHQDWEPIPHTPSFGRWTCITVPAGTRTRGLRIRFTRTDTVKQEDLLFGESDEERFARGDVEEAPRVAGSLDTLASPLAGLGVEDIETLFEERRAGWLGRLEGIKLLNRRFRDIGPEARVHVNSGTVDANGAWDAQRDAPIWDDDPGIYVMEWDAPREVAGLAIKEIDAELTYIDVWVGDGPVTLAGAAANDDGVAQGWRQVEEYWQPRRNAYQPSHNMNVHAIYMDGYVDFKQPIPTRAIRLRVSRQWLDNGGASAGARRHDGRHEHGVHYTQSHTAMLDTRICRVLGVAPLELLDEAAPTLTHQRLEVRDPGTGELRADFPVDVGWNALDVGPDGQAYFYNPTQRAIQRLDPDTGAVATLVESAPGGMLAVSPANEIALLPWRHDRYAVLVYGSDGSFRRGFGSPRRDTRYGDWDPARFQTLMEATIDGRGQLWVVEGQIHTRRIVRLDIESGRVIDELLGNTEYGGAGWLHRYRPDRAFHLGTEFALDWDTHTSSIHRIVNLPGAYAAVRIGGRTYLTSVPTGHHPRQSAGRVYLDVGEGPPRLVAAFGNAEAFGELRQAEILLGMAGDVPANYMFIWSDLNGDGRVDPDEVQLERKPQHVLDRPFSTIGLGRFDNALGCAADGYVYRVAEFLPDGTPIYVKEETPRYRGHLRLDNGNVLALHGFARGHDGIANQAFTPDGELVWRYPVHDPGVHGLGVASWEPGRVNNEFGIIGHETASGGDLGEFVVVHANTGQWNIWTADGHLAGQIFQHKSRPEARFFSAFEQATPGMRLDPIAMPQEAFHGDFVKYADGRYIALAGFMEMNLVAVEGLDEAVRVRRTIRVTDEDLRRTLDWEARRIRADVESRAMVVEARRLRDPIRIDGFAMDFEWPQPRTRMAPYAIYFSAAYDVEHLYLCWQDEGRFGRLNNTGDDFRRYFKTGAALDFMIGTDATADPERIHPVQGDVRILIAFINNEPRVVLYEPIAPDAREGEGWSVETPAGGRSAFDRVRILRNASAARNTRFVETQWNEFNQTTVEVRIPLADIGLTIDPEMLYAMDWGVIQSDDGIAVKERLYWANRGSAAAHTADEPTEARLEPRLWGRLRFEPYDVLDALLEQLPDRSNWPTLDF